MKVKLLTFYKDGENTDILQIRSEVGRQLAPKQHDVLQAEIL